MSSAGSCPPPATFSSRTASTSSQTYCSCVGSGGGSSPIGGIEGPPDLVVEITSGSTAATDRGAKREQYAFFGVPLYWIVDLEARHVEIYRLQEDPSEPIIAADELRWTPFSGGPTLTIPVPDLFRGFE